VQLECVLLCRGVALVADVADLGRDVLERADLGRDVLERADLERADLERTEEGVEPDLVYVGVEPDLVYAGVARADLERKDRKVLKRTDLERALEDGLDVLEHKDLRRASLVADVADVSDVDAARRGVRGVECHELQLVYARLRRLLRLEVRVY
jgi:uncharacterized protein YjbI with pentapeptide repeats